MTTFTAQLIVILPLSNSELHNNTNDGLEEWRELPIFTQGEVILHLVEYIVEYIELTDPNTSQLADVTTINHHLQCLMENALIIPVKIAGAHSADVYDIKMECATLIRKAAKEFSIDINGIIIAGFRDVEYLDLLRQAVENFRLLFIDWVATFNPSEFIIDSWGLFNPPGVDLSDSQNNLEPFDYNTFKTDLEDDWDESFEDDELI